MQNENTKIERLNKVVVTPRGKILIIARTETGVMYRHPIKGICGLRWDSMTPEEKTAFSS
jgi:hypothetical protein